MVCKKCGKKNPENSKFCYSCGESFQKEITFEQNIPTQKKDISLDKIFKLSLIVCIILIALSFGYYFVIVLPRQENEKINLQKQQIQDQKEKQVEEDRKKEQNKELLEACLNDVETTYSWNWEKSCVSNAKRLEDGYKNCITNTGLSESSCRSVWEKGDSSKDCLLPTNMADGIEETRKDQKDDCYKKYSLN